MEKEKNQNNQNKEKNKARGLNITYLLTIVKTVWHWQKKKNEHIDQWEEQRAPKETHTFGQLTFDRGNGDSMHKQFFKQVVLEQQDMQMQIN